MTLSPDEALARLKRGNEAFRSDGPLPGRRDQARRIEVVEAQSPYAVIVGCSDSRVPPELVFGAGLGELFVIRNAGSTIDTAALGSVQFGTLVLGAPLIVVLGHQLCGAMQAALQLEQERPEFPGEIGSMVESLVPAVRKAKNEHSLAGGALLDSAIRENVRRTVRRLREKEPTFTESLSAGRLRVVGAEYRLDDGRVEFFLE